MQSSSSSTHMFSRIMADVWRHRRRRRARNISSATRCLMFGALLMILTAAEAVDTFSDGDGGKDFRFISYEDLQSTSDRFTDGNVTTFSRLLFDVARDQVIVGARDSLYRLSLDLRLRENATWEATDSMMETCQNKGQRDADCRNYITVLQSHDNQLFACGTYAFSPHCSWRQMENLTVTRFDTGVARSPFNPHANITALLTNGGQLFVGTPTDFSGSDPAILRTDVFGMSSSSSSTGTGHRMLRTVQYNSKWLNDPQFVGSFEADAFVYFVFRETAMEYINCGKAVYSRIARVCKSDPGGERVLKENWTSFVKARLNCSLPGEFPFYFDEVQGMEYAAEEGVLYATFTTPINSIHGSAICAFNMSAIRSAFAGPFKHQEHADTTWQRHNTPHRDHYECRTARTGSVDQLLDSARYQLMDQAVQAVNGGQPLHHTQLERYTHLALDQISTKLHEQVRILYVATAGGLVKKLSVLPRTKETCLIEIWQPEKPSSPILALHFLKDSQSLYVGTENGLTRIAAHHCGRHTTRSGCLNAMDPYCGYNELLEACTAPPNGDTLSRYWLQNATACPVLTAPIDGGWSAWTGWSRCAQQGGSAAKSLEYASDGEGGSSSLGASANDGCLCRTRTCDNPAPRNGGATCTGLSIAVANCTVNGGWTDWSAWSACSQTCGVAVKTRRRTCGNPKPAHGGRVCVGNDRTELYCSQLPPCPVPKPVAQDGGWSEWGAWSECSVTACGVAGGFRWRRRRCDEPVPLNGGAECVGCAVDYEECVGGGVGAVCPEVRRTGPWTPWMAVLQAGNGSMSGGAGEENGQLERRYRFACRAAGGGDASQLKVLLDKEQTRLCQADGSCQKAGAGAEGVTAMANGAAVDEAGWTEWSVCSAVCGGGQQFRQRHCERQGSASCEQTGKMARACNTHSCKGEWGCWTEWSPCSVSCGPGIRTRTRKCLSMGTDLYGKGCDGPNSESSVCEELSCDFYIGWSAFSPWTDCNAAGEMMRTRRCLTANPSPHECQGNEREIRICPSAPPQAVLVASIGTGSIIMAGLLAIVASSAIAAYAMYAYMKRRQAPRDLKSIGSPCFDSFPNQYSSLPTKDDRPKVKRQTSFNRYRSSGTPSVSTATTSASIMPEDFGDCDGSGGLAMMGGVVAASGGGSKAKMLANGGHHHHHVHGGGGGTLTKSNNVTGHHQTPKVLAKTHFVDMDTATIKRNSNALNNVRPLLQRSMVDDDQF